MGRTPTVVTDAVFPILQPAVVALSNSAFFSLTLAR